jgi:hypothetical protein
MEYAYIFGAACPAKDKALGLVLPLDSPQLLLNYLGLVK